MAIIRKTDVVNIQVVTKKTGSKVKADVSHSSIIFKGIIPSENQMTTFEKMEKLKQGLSKTDLESFKKRTKLDYDKLSHVLSVTRSTLIKKKGNQTYAVAVAKRMLDLADIYSYGYKVFADEKKFQEWIFKPNHALGQKAPYDILDNQFGRLEVKNLIGRLEFGVHS